MQFLVHFASLLLLVGVLVTFPPVGTNDNTKLVAGLLDLVNQGLVTEEQVKKWWYVSEANRRRFPRTFPFCFDSKLDLPFNIPRQIIMDTVLITHYDPDEFAWLDMTKKTLFQSMQFNKISIQSKAPDSNVFGGKEGSSPFELQQWMDFKVTFREPINYFYVQAIGGPLGLPTGDFSTAFNCTEGDSDKHDYFTEGSVIPCGLAPKVGTNWPTVYVYHPSIQTSVNEIRFRYRWTESQCEETAFFQFIMFANTSVKTELILSPIYRHLNLDSASAVSSPYHPYYDKVTCRSDTGPSSNWITIGGGIRIIGNTEYDDCVVRGIGRTFGTLDTYTCPPGYLECDFTWKDPNEWKITTEKHWLNTVMAPLQDCCQLWFPLGSGPPTTTPNSTDSSTTASSTTASSTTTSNSTTSNATTTIPTTTTPTTTTTEEPLPTTPPPTERPLTKEEKQDRYLKKVATILEKKARITHGDICIFVWMVLTPVADLIARFFKDFHNIDGVGLGFWIIAHVGMHAIGLLFAWWSFGLVIGGGDHNFGAQYGGHLFVGIMITVIQHAQWITGLKRQKRESASFSYVLIHSLSGYVSRLLSLFCVIMSNAEKERRWLGEALFIAWVLAALTFHFMERQHDRHLEMVFHRAQCPVLQRIVLEEGASPPMAKTKIGAMVITTLVLAGIFTFALVYFPIQQTIEKQHEIWVQVSQNVTLSTTPGTSAPP